MADPTVQKQVAEMTAAMQNEKVQKRFEELRVRKEGFGFFDQDHRSRTPRAILSRNEKGKRGGALRSNAPQID